MIYSIIASIGGITLGVAICVILLEFFRHEFKGK